MGSENTGLLEVTMNGLIKTGEKRGKSTIIIAEEDSTQSLEDETIYVNVLTTNIFSIFVENSYKVTSLTFFNISLIHSCSKCHLKRPQTSKFII